MSMKLKHIVLFAENLEQQKVYYRDVLGLPVKRDRGGWVEFEVGGDCTLALHQGKGRKPRLDFEVYNLAESRQHLVAQGAQLSEIERFLDKSVCKGKDGEGNSLQITEILVEAVERV
jgi:catechol-2,3-dioxygenase